jgi:hypothetical protein
MDLRARKQTAAWILSGIPLLVATIQTVLALFGYTSSSAGLTPIAEPILSIPVLFEAAVVFKDSSVIVMGLFLLIALAWGGQGVATLWAEHREASYGAATLSAVLFFALFFGVYSPLLSAEIPTVQLGLFYCVPVLAAGLQFYAVATYPWNETVLEETGTNLGELSAELESIQTTFESGYQRRFEDVDQLSIVAPNGVEQMQADADTFRDRLDELEEKIETTRELDDGAQAAAAVREIEGEIGNLAPENRLDGLDSALREALKRGIGTRYNEISIDSELGDSFVIANLPTEYRELRIPEFDGPVRLNELRQTLEDLTKQADTVAPVTAAISAVEQHISELEAYISNQEGPVVAHTREAEQGLETVEELLDKIDTPFETRVEDVLINGVVDGIDGASDIEQQLESAHKNLLNCNFDAAEREADTAATTASTLVTTTELLSIIATKLDTGGGKATIPNSDVRVYIDELLPAMENTISSYTITVTPGDQLEFQPKSTSPSGSDDEEASTSVKTDGEADLTETSTDTTETDQQSSSTRNERVASPEDVVDEVLYALREFEAAATSADRVEYQTDDLPDHVASRDVLINLQRFANRQSDLFDEVEIQDDAPPGHISFASGDTSVKRALKQTHQRFREKYT